MSRDSMLVYWVRFRSGPPLPTGNLTTEHTPANAATSVRVSTDLLFVMSLPMSPSVKSNKILFFRQSPPSSWSRTHPGPPSFKVAARKISMIGVLSTSALPGRVNHGVGFGVYSAAKRQSNGLPFTLPTLLPFTRIAVDMQDRTACQRWASSDTHPGSTFHEVVAVPTLLPRATRPYQLLGIQPRASGLDQFPWAQDFLHGMRDSQGSYSCLCVSVAYNI